MSSANSAVNKSSYLGTGSNKTTSVPGLLDDDQWWSVMVVVMGLDVLTSIVANVFAIAVYSRLGFAISSNISLASLAVSDIIVAMTTIVCVMAHILPTLPGMPFDASIFFSTATGPHTIFTRVSAVITTYVSVEKYLCVLLPLRVKTLITPTRTFIVMLAIFVFHLGPVVLNFFYFPIGWQFFPSINKTFFIVLPLTDPVVEDLGGANQIYLSILVPALTMVIVLITTILLAASLRKSKAWRDANRSQPTSAAIGNEKEGSTISTSKEARAVKLVISIAIVFIVSSIPSSIHVIFFFAVPEFSFYGLYSKAFHVTGMAILMVDCINCGLNVIIYFNMSSNFRLTLLDLLAGKHAAK